MNTTRRELIAAGLGVLGASSAAAQQQAQSRPPAARIPEAPPARGGRGARPHRKVKTTVLFKSPGLYPNALALAPEGLWIGQQKLSTSQAEQWNQPVPKDRNEAAWLVDWNGKLLRTVMTESRNTSGMAYGDGFIWMVANTDPQGVFQTDMNSKTISHRQIPLGPADNGGGSHGAQWHNGKLWLVANRLYVLMRLDPKTWTPEFLIPIYRTPELGRSHDMTIDADGFIWQITGNNSSGVGDFRPGLVKYDPPTGQVLETAEFVPGSADPHGLEFHDGALISCDAGLHPAWKDKESPFSGTIFRIDFV